MKLKSESRGIAKLTAIRAEFAGEVRANFEHKAKPCSACESPGICCRDAHFVNVQITRLEATAIKSRLDELGAEKTREVYARAAASVRKFRLTETGDDRPQTYACPLFEPASGCLVHETAKPLPCIAHACYEDEKDLPPDDLLVERETQVLALNRRVYGRDTAPLPLPVAISRGI